ncbi:jg8087 [Pararge aegeria aegeria]|uniref:Jg8087 protein n=1 Tax=Pararge aegeria aegeria TaxID=348720 RepID=A0A8S4QWJ2_9NEOP|nr:jg8087 [Pararge aegeria aegeria]
MASMGEVSRAAGRGATGKSPYHRGVISTSASLQPSAPTAFRLHYYATARQMSTPNWVPGIAASVRCVSA